MRSTNGASRVNARIGPGSPKKLGVLVIGLIEAGVIDPPLELERRYFDRRLKAQIEPDGTVTCMGKSFCTLCSAATYARDTCSDVRGSDSHTRSSNGWAFWQYRNEAGELENIGTLRRRFLRG
ncbi:MAG TPA: hypothetical protein VGD06_16280 [Acidobacteriota bacterium]|jgi:hypothetical protein